MKLLHIDSSITGENSVSRKLTASIVAALTAADPTLDVTRRDLAAAPLGHLDFGALPGDGSPTAIESEAVLTEFLGADTVVIGAPMYNFTLPTQLKAWIDRVLTAGRTFRYNEQGQPEGLAGSKRVIVAVSRGGFYGAESPAAALEHLETYLTGAFGFIGITPEFVVAEGIAVGPDHRAAAIAKADEHILKLAA